MSDKAVADAIAALAKSQLLVVDVLRETQSTTRVISQTLGQILDQNKEIIARMDGFGGRIRESEKNLRVVQDQMKDVERRLRPLEDAHRAAQGSSRSSTG